MSGEHEVCPFCRDDMCDGTCKDALLDRIANYGIDFIAKDRRIAELEAEVGRLQNRITDLNAIIGANAEPAREAAIAASKESKE